MLELKFSKTMKTPKYTWVQVIFPRFLIFDIKMVGTKVHGRSDVDKQTPFFCLITQNMK